MSSSDRTARRIEQFSSRFKLIIESVVDRIEVDDHAIRIIGDEVTLEQVIIGSTKTAPWRKQETMRTLDNKEQRCN